MKYDVDLAKTIENAHARGFRSVVSHAMNVFPERNMALDEIAGAAVAYCAPQSNFNKAVGGGLYHPVSEEEIERIVAFFHTRGEVARIDVSPVADPDFAKKLGMRGFVLDDYENALIADLSEVSGRRDTRVEVCSDPHEWSLGPARAFEGDDPADDRRRLMRFAMATNPDIMPLVLRESGEVVTTGCLGIEADGFVGFFSTSTAEKARARGYQSALIGDRIARAQQLGKSFARAAAEVGSVSERNFRRFGFTPLFTRTIWVLPRPADA